ncbi:hypothetical protein P5V15_000606 [Pogonomyrmex californicus]
MLGGLQISYYAGLAKWCVINTELAVNRDESDATWMTEGRVGRDFGLFRPDRRFETSEKSRPFRKFLSRSFAVQRIRNSGFIRYNEGDRKRLTSSATTMKPADSQWNYMRSM